MPVNQELSTIKIREIKDALVRVRQLQALPAKDRKATDTLLLNNSVALIRETLSALVEQVALELFSDVVEDGGRHYDDFVTRHRAKLESPLARVPPHDKDQQPTSNEIDQMLLQIYKGQVTCYGILEEVEPVLTRLQSTRARVESLCKGLVLSDAEWIGESVFETLFPTSIAARIDDLAEVVNRTKVRVKALDAAFATLSRYIAVQLGMPHDEYVRRPAPPLGPTVRKDVV